MTDMSPYSPEVFELVIDTIPLLFRTKPAVVEFLSGAGVSDEDLADVSLAIASNPDEISKFEIVRRVLVKVRAQVDRNPRPFDEVISQVTQFDSFESCWPTDQQKARELVASVRAMVNAKDLRSRMRTEFEIERERQAIRKREDEAAAAARRDAIASVQGRLSALSGSLNTSGEQSAEVFNDLFRTYNIQVAEAFKRCDPDSDLVQEQLDGLIELDGIAHRVEIKWSDDALDEVELAHCLARFRGRPGVNGILISSSGYTQAAIDACVDALSDRTVFLCSLQEIELLLQRQDDLFRFLKKKARAAIVDGNPRLEILAG